MFDPRYLLLTSKERKLCYLNFSFKWNLTFARFTGKDVYEDFVRERVEEERREKRNRMKEKKDDFRRLMEDARLNGKYGASLCIILAEFELTTVSFSHKRSTFSDFAHKYGKDERFRGVEKTRERESLFNEFILEVRRREKDERDAQREKVRPISHNVNHYWCGSVEVLGNERYAIFRRTLLFN